MPMPTSTRAPAARAARPRIACLKPSEDAMQAAESLGSSSSPSPPRKARRRDEDDASCGDSDASDSDGRGQSASGTVPGCHCLRRGGLCSCRDDAQWLRTKRGQMTKYTPPHARRAVLQPAASTASAPAAASSCRCLRRFGRCSCAADDRWLQKKRKSVEPYVPPYLKERQRELEQKRQELAQRAEEAELKELAPNMRTLARQWEPKLEKGGFGFNPLQTEGKILCDELALEAECMEQTFSPQGVKALPVVQSGKHHFEVELLRDCQITVGWSSAMSHASSWDIQAIGYSSAAEVVHNNEAEDYGLPFGRKGDVVGCLLEWKASASGGRSATAVVSFMLNGRDLGPAAEMKEAVPLQPQVTQAATGLPFCLRLRKDLAYPKAGFRPLVDALGSADLCPFSRAVAQASAERASALITEEHLEAFMVPDAHVVELYDLEGPKSYGSDTARLLLQRLAAALNLPRPWSSHLAVLETEDATTALVAFKRASHAERLIEGAESSISNDGVAAASFTARNLNQATAAARQRLREWRAESGGFAAQGRRVQGSGHLGAARRLIHGSLQTNMPLSHLIEEKNNKRKRSG